MMDVGDGVFAASLTDALGSLQCCRARGEAASTWPIRRNDGVQVHRPLSRGAEGSDLARSWREQVQGHSLFVHEDSEGVPFPAIPGDFP